MSLFCFIWLLRLDVVLNFEYVYKVYMLLLLLYWWCYCCLPLLLLLPFKICYIWYWYSMRFLDLNLNDERETIILLMVARMQSLCASVLGKLVCVRVTVCLAIIAIIRWGRCAHEHKWKHTQHTQRRTQAHNLDTEICAHSHYPVH